MMRPSSAEAITSQFAPLPVPNRCDASRKRLTAQNEYTCDQPGCSAPYCMSCVPRPMAMSVQATAGSAKPMRLSSARNASRPMSR